MTLEFNYDGAAVMKMTIDVKYAPEEARAFCRQPDAVPAKRI